MDEENFDQILQDLVQQICSYPAGSKERQKLLNQFISRIWYSNQLGHPQAGQWPPNIYEDLYNEARQKTFLNVCKYIDSFNPEYPVMAWVNGILNQKFREAIADRNQIKRRRSKQTEPIKIISLGELESFLETRKKETPIYKILIGFFRTDPDKLLRQSMRNRPDITFRYLALQRLKNKKWEDISKKKKIPVATLSSFYQRKLEILKPYLRKHLETYFVRDLF